MYLILWVCGRIRLLQDLVRNAPNFRPKVGISERKVRTAKRQGVHALRKRCVVLRWVTIVSAIGPQRRLKVKRFGISQRSEISNYFGVVTRPAAIDELGLMPFSSYESK